MYLRIFSAHPPFQLACHATLLFILLPSAAITLLTIFSCHPVSYFWDRDATPSSSCLDVTALAYASAALAAAQDLVLALLPAFMLWRLNMPRARKLLTAPMFAAGSLGLVATAARVTTLSAFGGMRDPPWDYAPAVCWTTAELAAGLVCSCLPAVRILLVRAVEALRPRGAVGEGAGRGIRMERRRRPTAERDAAVGEDEEEGVGVGGRDEGWKGGEWMEDGVSQRGLTMSRDGGETSKMSSPKLSGNNHVAGAKHDFDFKLG